MAEPFEPRAALCDCHTQPSGLKPVRFWTALGRSLNKFVAFEAECFGGRRRSWHRAFRRWVRDRRGKRLLRGPSTTDSVGEQVVGGSGGGHTEKLGVSKEAFDRMHRGGSEFLEGFQNFLTPTMPYKATHGTAAGCGLLSPKMWA